MTRVLAFSEPHSRTSQISEGVRCAEMLKSPENGSQFVIRGIWSMTKITKCRQCLFRAVRMDR